MDIAEIQWYEYGKTEIQPLALLFTILMAIALVSVRRSRAIIPITLVACLVPVAQRLVVFDLDLSMLRLLIIAGWLRVVIRREARGFRWNSLDLLFVVWLVPRTLIYSLREATLAALLYRFGSDFDAIGFYFLLRFLTYSPGAVLQSSRQLIWIAVVIAITMSIEWTTGRNVFSVFGDVPEFTLIREGKLRCQGAFSHPIMAGSFGAGLAPIFLGMLLALPRERVRAAIGLAAAVLIVFFSSSSGPAIALLVAAAGWACWPLRWRMRELRWALLGTLLVLHVIREKPVWHLVLRLGEVVGGTGYHRYALIDAFLRHIPDWAVLGVHSTAHWGWGLQDVTNQFVLEGVRGGAVTLACFVAVLVSAFGAVGIVMRKAAFLSLNMSPGTARLLCWGFGSSLATHCASFISVSYFGQMEALFFGLLSFIASLCAAVEAPRALPHRAGGVIPSGKRAVARGAGVPHRGRAGAASLGVGRAPSGAGPARPRPTRQ